MGAWLTDCGPNLHADALNEFFLVWESLHTIQLDPEREDAMIWRWESDGQYSSRSAYRAFFAATTRAEGVDQVWRSRAPQSCRFFAWLASRNRCWTADRLQRRGLPHPASCPLCDQPPETLQHLLLGCVVSREVWARTVAHWGKPEWVPKEDSPLMHWWIGKLAPKKDRKDLWTAITMVFWCIWKHRNNVVFNG